MQLDSLSLLKDSFHSGGLLIEKPARKCFTRRRGDKNHLRQLLLLRAFAPSRETSLVFRTPCRLGDPRIDIGLLLLLRLRSPLALALLRQKGWGVSGFLHSRAQLPTML